VTDVFYRLERGAMMDGGWQDLLIYPLASGQAFFSGAALILTGVGLSVVLKSDRLMVARNLVVFLGAILVTVSATPLPYWYYGVLGVTTLVWLVSEWLKAKTKGKLLIGLRLAVVLVWAAALGIELPYHFAPSLSHMGRPELFVIGDSVTAGTGERNVRTWPVLLGREHGVTVHDFSHVGATAQSAARKQATQLGDRDGLVLLEIGGNDLLGTTSAGDFHEALDGLLGSVCRPGRLVLMFELPLPPFRNDFGSIQRVLAAEHGVILIPKRIFLGVLMTPGATTACTFRRPATS
jgi:acyl-CoA thioesterase-1